MSRSAQFETKIELARQALIEREHFQMRLQDLFLSLRKGSFYTEKESASQKTSFVAIFDHGIDPDPAFSGQVLARVYCDEQKNLAMALWPLTKEKKKKPWRSEILLSGVSDFQLQFLGKETESGIERLTWHNHWPQKRLDSPSIIRLMIHQKGIDLQYAFFPPHSEPLKVSL